MPDNSRLALVARQSDTTKPKGTTMRTIYIVSFWHYEQTSGFNWFSNSRAALERFSQWKLDAFDANTPARIRLVETMVPVQFDDESVTEYITDFLDDGDILPSTRVALVNV